MFAKDNLRHVSVMGWAGPTTAAGFESDFRELFNFLFNFSEEG